MTVDGLDQFGLPDVMWRSTLMRSDGVLVVRGLLPPDVLAALLDDFRNQEPGAKRVKWDGPNEAEWRGGEPARALSTVYPGPLAWHVCGSVQFKAGISELCGVGVEATGAGTYSYYCEPGDFLALHRDIHRCDVAVITCLLEEGPPASRLRTYPAFAWEPLSRVDRDRGVDVLLDPGDTAIIAGGVVPHEVLPLGAEQRRAVAITCFRLPQ